MGPGCGGLSDFLTVTNSGFSTKIEVDSDGLTIVLTSLGDGTLANLTDNVLV